VTIDAVEWLTRANARYIGAVEFRQVAMRIEGGLFSRTLKLRTLRILQNDVARSVFCITHPPPFANINYVTTEHRGHIDPFEISLYLPYALGTRRVLEAARRRETFLGGDFAYDDLRVWLPTQQHSYEMRMGRSSICLRGACTDEAATIRSAGRPFDVYLDPATAFVERIDYLNATGESIVRTYSVPDTTIVEGVVMPAVMVMHDYERRHRTSIMLERAWLGESTDEAIFAPEQQAQLHSRLMDL